MNHKKWMLYTFVLYFFMCAPALILRSQERAQQQKKQEIPKPAYEVEVIVTNVSVVVSDRDGQRITGLRPENFNIYEDGIRQDLTNFYEVKGIEVYAPSLEKKEDEPAPTPQPLPTRTPQFKNKIIFYFDNWQLHPLNRNQSIKRMEKFIRNNFSVESHNNEGMVISLGQKLEVLQEF
ncbi:MAG: hypothetical protein WA915_17495, partial [Candidatus Aminicenantaceae bacterium]